MKVGLVLPTFRARAEPALEVARRAEALGLDGVFCFDHLWPLHRPDRPALAPFPLLGALAVRTERLALGTLVARVGLVPDEVLLAEMAALEALAPGRLIAGLGTGDRQSAAENEAYGVPPASAEARREALRRCARALRRAGRQVWVGAGAAARRRTLALAEEEGVAVNLWQVPPEMVAEEAARTEVSWAGPAPPPDPGDLEEGMDRERADARALARLVDRLAGAGASWAVFAWPVPLETLARAKRSVGPE